MLRCSTARSPDMHTGLEENMMVMGGGDEDHDFTISGT